tara:strand:+ start:200 stop:499 length:300 start_codon:yes stop_codon:yes gene_type:complete
MLVHTVFFWLKADLSNALKEKFAKNIKTLGDIFSVESFHLGTPAPTPKRPVVEDSYDYAITVILKDMDAHNEYQADPIHLAFVDKCKDLWERVVIYDAD